MCYEKNDRTITIKQGEWYYDTKLTVFSTEDLDYDVTWSSNDLNIVGINYLTGYIYANNKGSTTIFATAIDGSEKTDYITINVV